MATDADVQEIIDRAEPGVNQAAFEAYERAAAWYFSAIVGPQVVVATSTASN